MLLCTVNTHSYIRIAGNFCGAKFVVFVVEHWTTNILPTNEATLLPLPASSNYEYINHELTILLNHKYFDPQKIPAIRYKYGIIYM